MDKARRTDDVFDISLRNRKDITKSFFGDYGGLPQRLEMMGKTDNDIRRLVRELMIARGDDGPFRLDAMGRPFEDRARDLIDGGLVAAVDGTDAVRPIPFLTTCSYVVAVGHVTSRMRTPPEIVLTETTTRYAAADRFRNEDLAALCDELDEIRDEGSWSTTFREYCERQHALDRCPSTIILDGPIFTQNLLTQSAGRALYEKMLADPSRTWIGVIKNISASYSEVRFCADALETGEGFVVGVAKSQLQKRFSDRADVVMGWITRSLPEDFIRVVYRPGLKAFAFECRRSELGLVVAILMRDASVTLHHELPMLLETIDAKLRGAFRSGELGQAIIGRVTRSNLRSGVDLLDERDLR